MRLGRLGSIAEDVAMEKRAKAQGEPPRKVAQAGGSGSPGAKQTSLPGGKRRA